MPEWPWLMPSLPTDRSSWLNIPPLIPLALLFNLGVAIARGALMEYFRQRTNEKLFCFYHVPKAFIISPPLKSWCLCDKQKQRTVENWASLTAILTRLGYFSTGGIEDTICQSHKEICTLELVRYSMNKSAHSNFVRENEAPLVGSLSKEPSKSTRWDHKHNALLPINP